MTLNSLRSALGAGLLATTALLLAGCAFVAPSGATTADDDDFGTVEVFAVELGELVPAADDGSAAATVWETFTRIATPEYTSKMFASYRVGDAPDSDTIAYVSPSDEVPGAWVLAANLAYADDEDLLRTTLVHEYAHVLSLNDDELDPEWTTCTTLELAEGCAREGSAILDFQHAFWDAYENAPETENNDAEIADAFYAEHEDEFVSAYAATNVTEDFAESFMAYVFENSDVDSSTSPVAAKLAFFDEHEELARIAAGIRAELGL